MVDVKDCEPELSYILVELCNNFLKGCCFADCWKVSSVAPVFKNVFLISSMVLGVFNELQIFLQLYLIELPGLLTAVGLLKL